MSPTNLKPIGPKTTVAMEGNKGFFFIYLNMNSTLLVVNMHDTPTHTWYPDIESLIIGLI